MSWWTDFRDTAENVGEGALGGFLVGGPVGAVAGGIAGGVGGYYVDKQAAEKKNAQSLINMQVNAYNKQTELSKQMLDATRNQEAVEKRRIEEKQIRSLRRNYGAQSSLGSQDSGQPDMSDKLGG